MYIHLIDPKDMIDDSSIDAAESDVDTESNTNVKCTFGETLFNSLNYCYGAIILTTPYSMLQSGSCLAFELILINIATFYTVMLMKKMSIAYPQVPGYTEMAQATLGDKGRNIAAIALICELYFYVVLYVIFAGELLKSSGYLTLFNLQKLETKNWCILITFFIILPTCYLNNLKPLSKMSAIGVSGIFIACILVIILFLIKISDNNTKYNETVFFTNAIGFGYGMGAAFGSYSFHPVVINMRKAMKEPEKIQYIIYITWAAVGLSQLIVSLGGYIGYGDNVQETVSSNYPTVLAYMAPFLLMFKSLSLPALCLYPVVLLVLKWVRSYKTSKIRDSNNSINNNNDNNDGISDDGYQKVTDEETVDKEEEEEEVKGFLCCKSMNFDEFLIRTVLAFVALGVAIAIPGFSTICTLIGTIATMMLEITLPSIMYIGFMRKQKETEMIHLILCIGILVVFNGILVWNLVSLMFYLF